MPLLWLEHDSCLTFRLATVSRLSDKGGANGRLLWLVGIIRLLPFLLSGFLPNLGYLLGSASGETRKPVCFTHLLYDLDRLEETSLPFK